MTRTRVTLTCGHHLTTPNGAHPDLFAGRLLWCPQCDSDGHVAGWVLEEAPPWPPFPAPPRVLDPCWTGD